MIDKPGIQHCAWQRQYGCRTVRTISSINSAGCRTIRTINNINNTGFETGRTIGKTDNLGSFK